jgi:hypothetical protein
MDFFVYSTDTNHPSLGHDVGRPAHCDWSSLIIPNKMLA